MWPIIGPPKLTPEGGPGPGGQSKGTWTLVLARPHGIETKVQDPHKSSCQVWGGRPPQSNGIAAQGGSGGGRGPAIAICRRRLRLECGRQKACNLLVTVRSAVACLLLKLYVVIW